jgi:hypothetical protein
MQITCLWVATEIHRKVEIYGIQARESAPVPKHHAEKVCGGVDVNLHTSQVSVKDGDLVISYKFRWFYINFKVPCKHWVGGYVGPRAVWTR